jgi:glutaredoxin-related protein
VDASTKDISKSKDLAALLKQLESELEKSPNDNEIRRAILNLKSEISLRDAQKLLDNHDG